MKIAFEVSKEKLINMIEAIDSLLDYYGCCPSEYPIDHEYYESLEESELAQAAYELGAILKSNL